MSRIVLAAAAAASIAVAGCSRHVDFERMRLQQRENPYAATETFADGMTMRHPPAGTIPYHGADRRAAVTSEMVARGRHEFEIYCAACHGDDGTGRSVIAANMPGNPLLSLLDAHAVERADAALFEVVSHGQNRMPSYDWAMPASDRWAVVAYVRTLQAATGSETGMPPR